MSDLLFFPSPFHYADVSKASDIAYSAQFTELRSEPISARNETNNWGFIVFLACFLIFVYIISQRAKLLSSMLSSLFRHNNQQSIFFESVNNELLNKLMLGFQSVLILSVILYCQAVHEKIVSPEMPAQMFIFMGRTSLLLIIFILYKYVSYLLAGTVFFKKEAISRWKESFFSIVCLSGTILFIPTLILFYVEKAYVFCMYFFLLYLFILLLIVFYKIYLLFFQKKGLLLYFILYLCTQEIIPLLLIYRGFVYLFNVVQKDTLWIQI
ncbi:MAG: DUF4271 domain-containing protein [Dysgonamonadaceae bacterium]|jgi:hypothetical protein|nr:DUF4271 domain-containing protein [Dysgonamonadaceae bacterium]